MSILIAFVFALEGVGSFDFRIRSVAHHPSQGSLEVLKYRGAQVQVNIAAFTFLNFE